ncbi:efflux transporter outer membrane subunit [Desulfatirhabdium butyrativorans]|uniref:efflux transporter outer membrane subunit n=1 Tax=Desulfatirhabdium butyrativorans TaxID=340467 RepID=UPI000429B29A|nr:efflux transporter outer membrane subunit [Desulfatirhabdium butyrativorans]
MRWIIALAMIACSIGCTVGPDYVRPNVDVPDAWRFEDKAALDTANTEWWKQFQDPVLDALIVEALENNKNIRLAAANIEKAAAALIQSRSQLFPQIGYSGSGTRQRATEQGATPVPSSVPNPQTSLQGLVNASWEIDLWGRIQRLSEAAQANLLATEEAKRGVILSLVSSVAGTYIQLLGLDMQLMIARRTLETYAESVRLFELQFQYGQISQMNVEQARTQYETAAGKIPQIESEIAQTEHALSILLGRNPGPIQRNRTLFELTIPAVPSGLPSDVLVNRPDIREAEQNLIAANAQIGAARALYFPSISLTGAFGTASAELSNLFDASARTWNFTGTVTGPIFKAGSISAQVQQAEAARKAALLTYEMAIQGAFADVENALVAREKLARQLQAQERLVKASKEYARLAQLQYEGGYVTYLTVLSAQQQLFPAELNHAQYLASAFASYVNIYKAMGGGWIKDSGQ